MFTTINPHADRSGERGLTLIEILIVLGIIGVLSNIAVPAYRQAELNARVVDTVADFQAVRTAATDYYLQTSRWPDERSAGEVPPELAEALAGQLDWNGPAPYDWDNLLDEDGSPIQPESGVAIGFSVRSDDEVFLERIRNAMAGRVGQTWGWGVTLIIEPVGFGPGSQDFPSDETDIPEGRGNRGRGKTGAPGQNR